MTFRYSIPHMVMVNSFVVSLDIPVMINILYEMIKILCEKMLDAIYLYWFHNDTLAENNSLIGHSNEPLNKCIEFRHISCQVIYFSLNTILITVRHFFSYYIFFLYSASLCFSSSGRFLYRSRPYCRFFSFPSFERLYIFYELFFVVFLCYFDNN